MIRRLWIKAKDGGMDGLRLVDGKRKQGKVHFS
jgi:hypothetical protein